MRYLLLFSLLFASSFTLAEGHSAIAKALEAASNQNLYELGIINVEKAHSIRNDNNNEDLVESLLRDAILLFQKPALKGHLEAQYQLGNVYLITVVHFDHYNNVAMSKGLAWLTKAAHRGHPIAQGMIGYSHYKGLFNLPVNEEKGLYFLEQSVTQGELESIKVLNEINSKKK